LKKFHQNFNKNRASRDFFDTREIAFGFKRIGSKKPKIARKRDFLVFVELFLKSSWGLGGEAPKTLIINLAQKIRTGMIVSEYFFSGGAV